MQSRLDCSAVQLKLAAGVLGWMPGRHWVTVPDLARHVQTCRGRTLPRTWCPCLLPCGVQPAVWQSIRQRLAPGGRVMCNLGPPPGMAGANPAHVGRTIAALDAMAEAFEGEW
jgi:hypothetical protein